MTISGIAAIRAATLGLTLLSLGACREEEQDRTLGFEPGVYQGAEMPELDNGTRGALRTRVENQDF